MAASNHLSYVLITPARNEEAYIEKTLQSVVSQTVKPAKWVIVSDASTDRTDELVKHYMPDNPWIELIRMPEHRDRQFAAKVQAFNAGFRMIGNTKYDLIGNLDADISFDKFYYENILKKFIMDDKLGIAGGDRYDIYDGKCEKVVRSRNSVMGAVQLFRRKCYEDVGGYIPLEKGGIDAVAEIMARMRGWKVESFSEIIVYHHRRTGTATTGVIKARFRDGCNDYVIGYHPLFELLRCFYQIFGKHYFLGGITTFSGYCFAFMKRFRRQVPDEFIEYLRKEQISRLREAFIKMKRKH